MINPKYSIKCIDAFAWLKQLKNESVDLIITDPPYESLEKYRAIGTTTRLKISKGSNNEWFPIISNERFEELFKEFYRILRNSRHFYLFCDIETMFYVKPIAEKVGFKFWKPLIWDKVSIGMGYHYRSRYENILFFEKGKRKLNDLAIPDIISCKRVHNGFPTEKPVGVSEILIKQSSLENELVIDPFLGSGSVAVASLKNKRHFSGCDVKENAVQLAQKRILELKVKENAS